jgi:hypothetical protein
MSLDDGSVDNDLCFPELGSDLLIKLSRDLVSAAAEGNSEGVCKLIDDGADMDWIWTAGSGGAAIHRAARNGHEDVVRILLEVHRMNVYLHATAHLTLTCSVAQMSTASLQVDALLYTRYPAAATAAAAAAAAILHFNQRAITSSQTTGNICRFHKRCVFVT